MPATSRTERRAARSLGYAYPDHLRTAADALPKLPGVYTFHGQEGLLPLYIGKSIDIRTRVLSHFRQADEAALLRQSADVQCVVTAGDLGAQLLEAAMVKAERPLYNRLLRKVPRQFSLRLYRGKVDVVHSAELDLATAPMTFGLYSSERAAKSAIRRVADENRLCYSLVGLERLPPGRPCFRSMLRQCAGACCGGETPAEHAERLAAALSMLEIADWSYGGPVAIEEVGDHMHQFHVVDAWRYYGSASTLAEARRIPRHAAAFDRDAYRILRAAFAATEWPVFAL